MIGIWSPSSYASRASAERTWPPMSGVGHVEAKKAMHSAPRKIGEAIVTSLRCPEVSQGSFVIRTSPGRSVSSGHAARKCFIAACPLETLRPGDVLITNDPWLTSGHLNDVTIASPIFRGAECIAFFASTCPTPDIGGHVLSA